MHELSMYIIIEEVDVSRVPRAFSMLLPPEYKVV